MQQKTLTRAVALALVFGLTSLMAATAQPAGKKPAHKASSARKHPHPARPDADTASQWTPDAKLLSQLQPERQFAGYSLRIPIGFTVEEHDPGPSPKGQITQFLVKGPTRPDGTFLAIFVTVGVAAPGFATGSTDALLAGNDVINGKEGLTKSDPQDGMIDGLSVTRQYYKYPSDSGWIHGFHYATTDGHTDAMVAAMDAEPHNVASLPLAEAAALTLHKTL